MSSENSVIELFERLPDEIDAEQLIEELFVRAKVEAGERALEEGRTRSHDEAKREVEAWRK